jgi:hypothetical protein
MPWSWRRISSPGSAGSSAVNAWPISVSIARFTAGARVGRNLATRTVVPAGTLCLDVEGVH